MMNDLADINPQKTPVKVYVIVPEAKVTSWILNAHIWHFILKILYLCYWNLLLCAWPRKVLDVYIGFANTIVKRPQTRQTQLVFFSYFLI